MRQYYDIKSKHKDLIVFFRLGDFYEMFDADAKEVSSILGIALTARHGIPMCGVPYHAASAYLSKLIKAGRKVGICEQVGVNDSSKTKMFERKIVRILTPGTVLEDNMLESTSSNYLVSVALSKTTWAVACADVSTGEFWITQNEEGEHMAKLAALLASVNPSEIIIERQSLDLLNKKIDIPSTVSITVVNPPDTSFVPPQWPGMWEGRGLALTSALALTNYITLNDEGFKDIFVPFYKEISSYLSLDENAIRTLEITQCQSGGKKGSLWHLLDYTNTPMGSRTLKNWLLNPLLDIKEIKKRAQSVEGFYNNEDASRSLINILKEISDVERIMSRTATGSASPRDLGGLRRSLSPIQTLKVWLERYGSIAPAIAKEMAEVFSTLDEIYQRLVATLEETPPIKISDGGIIRTGFSAELDELRDLRTESGKYLEKICESEKVKTGITNLKVGFTSVFGYYLEVTKGQASKIPYNYKRTQTLTNAERFTTDELKVLEQKILNAEERMLRLESALFDDLRKYLAQNIKILRLYASSVAELDIYNSFAHAAKEHRFVKPEILEEGPIKATNVRHPVVENNLPAGTFVPNDISIGDETQISIITGPNMGGKSVYLKQSAILVILAQVGSFVPAEKASIGIVDKIMTRIGAQDALNRNESTFMVEMKETSNILASATKNSLILLDEVGRGTSTFDGVSIAWAITEFLYKPEGGAKVLFATHYFELTDLVEKYPKINNLHVEVHEYKDDAGASKIAFMYKIKEGPADKSYGIHVAELAGLPQSCIVRAKKVLKDLEEKKGERISKKEKDLAPDIFSSPLVEEIRLTDVNKLTPIEALQLISEWKKRINE